MKKRLLHHHRHHHRRHQMHLLGDLDFWKKHRKSRLTLIWNSMILDAEKDIRKTSPVQKTWGDFLEFSCWPWRSFFFKEEIRTMGRPYGDRILNSTQHPWWTFLNNSDFTIPKHQVFFQIRKMSRKILQIKQNNSNSG